MPMTLDEARGIVAGFGGVNDWQRRQAPIRLPNTGSGPDVPGTGRPGGGGGDTGGSGAISGPTFDEAQGDQAALPWLDQDGIWRDPAGAALPLWQQKILNETGGPGPTDARDTFNTDRSYNRGVFEDDRNFGRGTFEDDRNFGRGVFESDRGFGRGVLESDRNFGQGQIQDNRTELGNRAGTALSFSDLLLNMAKRDDQLANDPGNFPAWLASMQGNTAAGPAVQNLVGQGVSIQPQQNSQINDPRFQSIIDSLFNYSKVPDSGAVAQTQQAFNTDPQAAQRWFEAASALDKSRGMAHGGLLHTNGPMRMQDLTTGETLGVAGEQGPETVNVTPAQQLGATNTPRIGSAGTFGALAQAIQSSGMGSAFPRDVLARMASGFAPNPGDVPDWLLAKLPPSLRGMLGAGVLSQLGGAGAQDYDFTRSLYAQKGFSGAGGVVR